MNENKKPINIVFFYKVIALVFSLILLPAPSYADIKFSEQRESTGIRSFVKNVAYHHNWIIDCTQQTSGRLYSETGKSCTLSQWGGSKITADGLRASIPDLGFINIKLGDRGVNIEFQGRMHNGSSYSIQCEDFIAQGTYQRRSVGQEPLFSSTQTAQILEAMRNAQLCVTKMTVYKQSQTTRREIDMTGFSESFNFSRSWLER